MSGEEYYDWFFNTFKKPAKYEDHESELIDKAILGDWTENQVYMMETVSWLEDWYNDWADFQSVH